MRNRPGSCLLILCATVLLGLVTASRAASLEVEINGRDFYGTLFVEGGEVYAPLDVVGPLILGSDFGYEDYDMVLRRATYHFTPPGKTRVRQGVSPCIKRGVAVYVPLKSLVVQAGGSYALSGTIVKIAYPPVSVVAPTPVSRPSPSPTTVAGLPSRTGPAPLAPEAALMAARHANQGVLRPGGLIRRIELFHPVSPDPSEAIPRTDLAGLKVFVKKLAPRDQVWIAMWNGPEVGGAPAFEKHLQGFRGQELQENCFFVRLTLPVEPGWHTVKVDLNHRESAVYRFITY